MPAYRQSGDLVSEVLNLSSQGLTDNLIAEELKNRGYTLDQVDQALNQAVMYNAPDMGMPPQPMAPAMPMPSRSSADDSNIYERIEQITESMIDEKWDELLAEVKKIIEWKEKVEEKQNRMINDLENLKEDFKTLHEEIGRASC